MPTLLVVDDDSDVRALLETVLGADGHTVITATDGRDALQQLRTCDPSLILLDLMMAGMDGETFRDVQQRDPHLAQIPVLCLSARYDAAAIAARIGCCECLPKPFDVDDLLRAVRLHASTQPVRDTRSTASRAVAREAAGAVRYGGQGRGKNLPGL